MRQTLLILAVITAAGCGSNSDDTQKSSGGVPLSINSPAAADGDAAGTGKPEIGKVVSSQAVKELIERAELAAGTGRNAVAIEALSQAIGVNPDDARLFRLRGDVYVRMGENANARADYSLAIQTDPNDAELYNVRGYFLMTHGAAGSAAEDFEKAKSLNPKLAIAWNNRGLVYLADKDFESAEEQFAKAIELDADYVDAWNNRGFTRMKAEKWKDALADLQQAVTIDPNYVTAWNNSGLAYMQQESYENAAKCFSEAMRLSPLDARWVSHRRSAYLKLDKFDEATEDAQRIQWINELAKLTQTAAARPGDPQNWLRRAEHLIKGGEFKGAVQDYSRVLALAPGNTAALNGRARAYLKTGNHKSAIADCDESIISDSSSTAYSVRGDAWFALKQYDRAVQDFESARRFDSVVAEAYRQCAAQHKAAGDTAAAQAALTRAQEIKDGLAGRLSSDNTTALPTLPVE